ncbi:MAG: phosphoethanolamine transferase CptA [Bacteroides sp.]|nr:phosphoethanolamine transferase CptA [Bacteroides sp.]
MRIKDNLRSFLCLLCMGLPGLSLAQKEVRVWAEFDTSGWIGDGLELRLCCLSDAPEKVNFPILQDRISDNLQLVPEDSLRVKTSSESATGLSLRSVSYRFSAYKEGVYTMPAFPFEFVRNDSLLQLRTDTGLVRFFAPVVDTVQPIKDIRATFEVSRRELFGEYFDRYGFWLWIVLGVAALTIAGIYLWRRFKQGKPLFVPQKPPVPPIDRALAELKTLKEKQLWQQNRVKEYYTELTDILRVYLSGGMGIAAVEMTNDELSSALKESLASEPDRLNALLSVLDRSVLVKFAKVLPPPDEHEDSFRKVSGFLDYRKAKEAEQTTENGERSEAPETK